MSNKLSGKAKLAVLFALGMMAVAQLACSDSVKDGNNASVELGQKIELVGKAQNAYDSAVDKANEKAVKSVDGSTLQKAGSAMAGK